MKEELLQRICNRLNDKGLTEYNADDILSMDRRPFSVNSGEVAAMRYLPEENLKMIADYDISKYTDFKSVYQAWGRQGFFKFRPYIMDENDNPTLCLRHNKFLHMFRGYYYQISGTHDGIGSDAVGLMRTDGLLKVMRYEDYSGSHLGFIMLYAAMIDCGFQNDNFRYLFYNDRETVDEYFRQSMRYFSVKVDYGFDVVSKYISYRDGCLGSKDCGDYKLYYITGAHGYTLCRFWISPDVVEVEYCYDKDSGVGSSKIVRFEIPSPLVGIDLNAIEDDEDDVANVFDHVCYGHERVEHFILLMLLKLVGIHSNFITSYTIKKIGSIKKINDAGAQEICKFDEIM